MWSGVPFSLNRDRLLYGFNAPRHVYLNPSLPVAFVCHERTQIYTSKSHFACTTTQNIYLRTKDDLMANPCVSYAQIYAFFIY